MNDKTVTSDCSVKESHFTHDCTEETYLGAHYFPHNGHTVWDLYFCPSPSGLHTIRARWGNDGPDYISADVTPRFFADLVKLRGDQYPMVEAYRRARERGLLS